MKQKLNWVTAATYNRHNLPSYSHHSRTLFVCFLRILILSIGLSTNLDTLFWIGYHRLYLAKNWIHTFVWWHSNFGIYSLRLSSSFSFFVLWYFVFYSCLSFSISSIPIPMTNICWYHLCQCHHVRTSPLHICI